jgi:hypothetical protein
MSWSLDHGYTSLWLNIVLMPFSDVLAYYMWIKELSEGRFFRLKSKSSQVSLEDTVSYIPWEIHFFWPESDYLMLLALGSIGNCRWGAYWWKRNATL